MSSRKSRKTTNRRNQAQVQQTVQQQPEEVVQAETEEVDTIEDVPTGEMSTDTVVEQAPVETTTGDQTISEEQDVVNEEPEEQKAPALVAFEAALAAYGEKCNVSLLPNEVAKLKMPLASALVGIVNHADYDVFSNGWKQYVEFVEENVTGCMRTDVYEQGFMYGMLPPAWVWGQELRDKYVSLGVLASEIVEADDVREYLESRDFSKLVQPPVSLTDNAVNNLSKFYNK